MEKFKLIISFWDIYQWGHSYIAYELNVYKKIHRFALVCIQQMNFPFIIHILIFINIHNTKWIKIIYTAVFIQNN